MKFLSTLLDGVTEYETLVSAVERHNTPAAVTGVSGIHKAHLIHSLCARTGRKALVLASDEGEGQRLCNDLSSMGTAALVYPARDFNFRAAEGQSREYEHQRLQVMAGMLDGDYQVVISCIDAALQYTIPPDELPLLFERFHKADYSRSVDREGVGLGLYIVKTILGNLKENITATSEDGVTQFTFTLTLA